MKNEAEFCTCIVKSLKEIGTGYKIPDACGTWVTTERCFDIIGRIGDKACYIEAKYNANPGSFNLKRIEPHQYKYLNEFSQVKDSLSYIIFGMYYGRADTRSFIFDWNIMKKLYEQGFSFHQKHLEKLPYNPIKKGLFEFKNIITEETLKNLGILEEK